jgi:dGTPase
VEWAKLLDRRRLRAPDYPEKSDRPAFSQDADRITFSAPFRRLANKTQVHPLYENDHIHHRLIHSVETASVGRSLGISVGDWLEKEHGLEEGDRHVVAGVVQAACLAHDIGNPPFGHSGEAAIGEWFAENFDRGGRLFRCIEEIRRDEFKEFEGNAQGFRLLSRLEMYRNDGGMRLSRSVLGAFTKYPSTAHAKNASQLNYCGLKKFGIFESELNLFAEIAEPLGLPAEGAEGTMWWRRHPLVFLVEAADDICYNILDLEDAFASGEFSYQTVMQHLQSFAGNPNHDVADKTEDELVSYARARSIGVAIQSCVEAFKENYDSIMQGSFSNSLVECSSLRNNFAEIKKIARERLFTSKRKTELEVSGRNVVRAILNSAIGVYERLMECDWRQDDLGGYHRQLWRAIGLDLRDVIDPYTALHSLTDYVSGMTDRYAVRIARMVSGA